MTAKAVHIKTSRVSQRLQKQCTLRQVDYGKAVHI
jgi:hypothetical protein